MYIYVYVLVRIGLFTLPLEANTNHRLRKDLLTAPRLDKYPATTIYTTFTAVGIGVGIGVGVGVGIGVSVGVVVVVIVIASLWTVLASVFSHGIVVVVVGGGVDAIVEEQEEAEEENIAEKRVNHRFAKCLFSSSSTATGNHCQHTPPLSFNTIPFNNESCTLTCNHICFLKNRKMINVKCKMKNEKKER